MQDLTTTQARRNLVSKWATKYGLQIEMVCAVIDHETGGTWDTFTAREEPAFYARYIADAATGEYKVHIPPDSIRSISTEARQRSFSWGLMQVMGQTARELGLTSRYLSSLCDPDVGIDYGCRKLQRCFSIHGADESGLLAYNGGGNPEYGKEVLARVAKYVIPTVVNSPQQG